MNRTIDEPSFRDLIYVFKDRIHAGRLLAQELLEYAESSDVMLLAVPAGGSHLRLWLPMN